MFIKTAYNRGPRTPGLICEDESRTLQSEEKSANINNIVDRAMKTGMITVRDIEGLQGDFTGAPTFQELKDHVLLGMETFMKLPAKVRERFANDPGTWLRFMDDKDNLEEMIALGLIVRDKPPIVEPERIMKVEVVNGETVK